MPRDPIEVFVAQVAQPSRRLAEMTTDRPYASTTARSATRHAWQAQRGTKAASSKNRGTDMAAECAGLRRQAYLAGRVGIAADASSAQELCRYLMVEAADLVVRDRERVTWPRGRLTAMCALAVVDLLEPSRFRWDTDRRDFLVVPPAEWANVWAPRYRKLVDILQAWVSEAEAHFR